MKFLVDAHLPPGLCGLLQAAGHDALHTSHLPAQNRTPDRVINELSLQQQRVVVTKDSDFYNTHLLRGEPWKLLLVRTGNIRARELKQLFQRHLPAISVVRTMNLMPLPHEDGPTRPPSVVVATRTRFVTGSRLIGLL